MKDTVKTKICHFSADVGQEQTQSSFREKNNPYLRRVTIYSQSKLKSLNIIKIIMKSIFKFVLLSGTFDWLCLLAPCSSMNCQREKHHANLL